MTYLMNGKSEREIVSSEKYSTLRSEYTNSKKQVLLCASIQLVFATALFTLGLYNIMHDIDPLLLSFAAPFQLISAMLALITVHMGKETRGLCKATQAFTGISMILAEIGYRFGVAHPQEDKPFQLIAHFSMLFISAYIDLLLFVACAYFFEAIKKLVKVKPDDGTQSEENTASVNQEVDDKTAKLVRNGEKSQQTISYVSCIMLVLAIMNWLAFVFHGTAAASHSQQGTAFDHGGRNISPSLMAALAFLFVSRCDVSGVASRQILLICSICMFYFAAAAFKSCFHCAYDNRWAHFVVSCFSFVVAVVIFIVGLLHGNALNKIRDFKHMTVIQKRQGHPLQMQTPNVMQGQGIMQQSQTQGQQGMMQQQGMIQQQQGMVQPHGMRAF